MALILLALSVAGFIGTFINYKNYHSIFTEVEFLAFGFSAFAASYALWTRRTWAYRAFVVWAFVVINGVIDYQTTRSSITWTGFLPALAFIVLLMILGTRYIRKATES